MPATRSQQNDRAVYLAVFDAFGTTKSDLASELNMAKAQVTKSLNRLEAKNLVTHEAVNGDADGTVRDQSARYAEHVWQCWQTYDSISREQAEEIFDIAYGLQEGQQMAEAAEALEENAEMAEAMSWVALASSSTRSVAQVTQMVRDSARRVPLTNSQRRALVKLVDGSVRISGVQARQPYIYLKEMGLCTAAGHDDGTTTYALTEDGHTRAADVDKVKYAS